MNETIDDLIAEAVRWSAEREVISAKEASGKYPHPDEWHGSDDWAADIADRLAGFAD